MTAIRPTSTIAARPIARATAAAAPAAVKASTPVKPVVKPPVVEPKATDWTLGKVLKTAGVGVGGFVGGNVATFVVDLFFHFGNNGGTAFAGGIYTAAAGLTALGAMALYHHLSSKK